MKETYSNFSFVLNGYVLRHKSTTDFYMMYACFVFFLW